MTFDILLKGSILGIISGVILGIILKITEILTKLKVYTLLLNIDFIPVAGDINWPELMEFLFHLIVSVFLGILFYYLASRLNFDNKQRFFLAAGLTFPALLLYFPLSILAEKDVPALNDWAALFYWSTGHLLYAVCLTLLFPILKKWKS
ncbi:hypothetical protein [Bacillus sp. SG-1]|uniref:hypothetical protein n=1 Tax=Bacillus sp. SG-1 TaxID=161544 RepID=UPI0006949A40|nr:hypothetical protein [Bacillus sp. SG-1]